MKTKQKLAMYLLVASMALPSMGANAWCTAKCEGARLAGVATCLIIIDDTFAYNQCMASVNSDKAKCDKDCVDKE